MLWITVAIFAATIATTTATGKVEWTVQSIETKVTEAGRFDPTVITGADTFAKVSELSGIPKAEVLAKLKITEQDFEKPIRDPAHREGSGFDTTAVKDWIAEKLKQERRRRGGACAGRDRRRARTTKPPRPGRV